MAIAEHTEDSLIGQTLDAKYRIEQRLSAGGMGAVYRARHLQMDRPVAIKVLHQRFVGDEAARVRFQREARAAVRLQHQNAVSVTDFGETADGYVYLVMELLEGPTLREILVKEAPIETARGRIDLIMDVASGAVPQKSDPAEEKFYKAYTVSYWTMPQEEAQQWLDAQFGGAAA